jgi:hypothetical protein
MQACWAATNLAAEILDQEAGLFAVLARAIAALKLKPFVQRIADVSHELSKATLS